MPTIHLIIKGKVQGVFYRASAKKRADKLGITGWVKNTNGGEVEVMASGNEAQLKLFVDWCRQGPDNAKVEEVISSPKEDMTFKSFLVTHE